MEILVGGIVAIPIIVIAQVRWGGVPVRSALREAVPFVALAALGVTAAEALQTYSPAIAPWVLPLFLGLMVVLIVVASIRRRRAPGVSRPPR